MQTRSSHLDSNPSTRGKHAVKLGPPGVWDRDPLEDATGAMLLTPLPESLAHARRETRHRVGAERICELQVEIIPQPLRMHRRKAPARELLEQFLAIGVAA